jgi:excisionase family DNA binding protein
VKSKVDADNTKDNGMALKTVLKATGGDAKVRELFQLLTAEEAAEFLALDLGTVRNLTYRRELPCVKVGRRGVKEAKSGEGRSRNLDTELKAFSPSRRFSEK